MKRKSNPALKSQEQQLDELMEVMCDPNNILDLHANPAVAADLDAELPRELKTWFERLRLLHGVPLHYLLADPRLLPPESLRFFQVNPNWLHRLVDGAFSIGRTTEQDVAHDQAFAPAEILSPSASSPSRRAAAAPDADQAVAGFLLRSKVVGDWPGMRVTADFQSGKKDQPPLRLEALGPGLLLGLFAEEITTLQFAQPAELLCFGLPADHKKALRGLDGKKVEEKSPAAFRAGRPGVLNVAALAQDMKGRLKQETFTAADFAFQMVQGLEVVRCGKVKE
jgi:hypothetical protein